MRTSIEIADSVLERARRLAEARGTTLRSLVEDGLRRLLEEAQAPGPAVLPNAVFPGVPGFAPGVEPSNLGAKLQELMREGRDG